MGLIKLLFTLTNAIFWATGGTMLGVGIWLAVDSSAFDNLNATGMDDSLYAAAVYIMISIGALVFLVGFLGFFGGRKESGGGGLLKIYFVVVKIIVILEIITIILIAIFWSSIDDGIANGMQVDVQTKYNHSDNQGITNSWNTMQEKWECCGSYNYTDYRDSYFADHYGALNVPASCCKDQINMIALTQCKVEAALPYNPSGQYLQLNPSGCYYGLKDFVDRNSPIILGITCGFIGLQILGLIFSCILMKQKK
jgi:hypothetical protein